MATPAFCRPLRLPAAPPIQTRPSPSRELPQSSPAAPLVRAATVRVRIIALEAVEAAPERPAPETRFGRRLDSSEHTRVMCAAVVALGQAFRQMRPRRMTVRVAVLPLPLPHPDSQV